MNAQFKSKLLKYRTEIDNRLSSIKHSGGNKTFFEPIRYSLKSKGKRIRPILVLLTGEGFGLDFQELMPAALAVEIMHTFTLVHDDIMDNDTHRRGMPTVHIKWDENKAILTGDSLMALSFMTLMKLESPNIAGMGGEFSQAMLEICEGQDMDLEFETKIDVTCDQYLNMITKKTGRLLGLCCQLGAMAAQASQEIVNELYNFGLELGQAFQIQDDLFEIISDEKKMGKSLGSDFTAGKKTFPLIHTISTMNENYKKKFLSFIKKNSYNREVIYSELKKRDSIKKSEELIEQLLNKARNRLQICPKKTRKDLENLIIYISNRQS